MVCFIAKLWGLDNYLSPLRGSYNESTSGFLGLTPQAKYLSPLRGSPQIIPIDT